MAVPIYIPSTITFTGIAVYCDTLFAASVVRLGIYSPTANNLPGSLLLDAGTVSTATTGAKEIAISQQLTQGVYWLAAVMQTASGAQLRSANGYAPPMGLIPENAANATAPSQQQWFVGGTTTGALPASPTWSVANGAHANNGPLIIFLKV